MRSHYIRANVLAAALVVVAALLPVAVGAQENDYHHRQQTKNEWRNIAIGSGALGVLGLLRHDSTLAVAGTAGSLYSAWRYDQDRKSQNRYHRARAEYFSRPYFYRDGHRYTRKTIRRHGQKYYQFVRD